MTAGIRDAMALVIAVAMTAQSAAGCSGGAAGPDSRTVTSVEVVPKDGEFSADDPSGGEDPLWAVEERPAMEKDCEAGDAEYCFMLAVMLHEGEGLEQDLEGSRKLFASACSLDHAEGCFMLGAMVSGGEGGPEDDAQARDLFSKACAGGSPAGCHLLGLMWEQGLGGDKSESKAAAHYEKACAGGEPRGCFALGTMWYEGKGVPEQNHAKARSLFGIGCNAGDAQSCMLLAVMMQKGQGGDTDAAAASELLAKSCDLGEPLACNLEDSGPAKE